jgi:hypothetical protein
MSLHLEINQFGFTNLFIILFNLLYKCSFDFIKFSSRDDIKTKINLYKYSIRSFNKKVGMKYFRIDQ